MERKAAGVHGLVAMEERGLALMLVFGWMLAVSAGLQYMSLTVLSLGALLVSTDHSLADILRTLSCGWTALAVLPSQLDLILWCASEVLPQLWLGLAQASCAMAFSDSRHLLRPSPLLLVGPDRAHGNQWWLRHQTWKPHSPTFTVLSNRGSYGWPGPCRPI